MNNYKEKFIAKVLPGAMQLWEKFGILPSVAIGQAALESGWGRSRLATAYNNLFGIKGHYQGNSKMMNTWEVYDGKRYDIEAGFRVYPDWTTSILDYGVFLTVNPRYGKAIGIKDYERQITAIHRAGYATDPEYVDKVISIIWENNLFVFDYQVLANDKPAEKETKAAYPAKLISEKIVEDAYIIDGHVYIKGVTALDELGYSYSFDNKTKTLTILR